ncbi:glucose 1-dehydrogenase [Fusibacter paucivorans]|uniref:Glucose 1-dehydrogenase n=1 Tax=Fusibacter paucivorans TaxID=76009 RepID=A0ABS5PL73_9FIRM|nr:glucose 1-dehydrogenase [Fusibacter paucivorans]MBS7525925.1 glucose 1-dehydrogenase [Fusibacter paucivorans]
MMKQVFDFQGKTAVVTGGNRGLGKACTEQLMANGCQNVVVVSNSGVCDLEGPLYIQGDVAKRSDVEAAMHQVIEKFGRIDILINNAGISTMTDFLEIEEQEYDKVLSVNLKGSFFCCQEAIKQMMIQQYGRIVNIASTAGITGGSVSPHYGVSKAGLIALTQSLGRRYAPHGILTNCVAPGEMKTDMFYDLFKTEESREKRVGNIPVKRIAEPAEVANMVLYMASDMASYMTGETVRVSGGRI